MYNPQLDTFLCVAESGSFNKAAEKLYITPTAVMKQINALEKRVGAKLLERSNHGLFLTDAGRSFLRDARYLIDYSRRAVAHVREIDHAAGRKCIRLGFSAMMPARFPENADLTALSSRFRIELVPFLDSPENFRDLFTNFGRHLDAVTGVYDEELPDRCGCRALRLGDESLRIAVPFVHPFAQKEEVSLDDLAGKSVMLVGRGYSGATEKLRQSFFDLGTRVVEVPSFGSSSLNRAASESLPLLIAEDWLVVHPFFRVLPFRADFRFPYGILYSAQPTSEVLEFVSALAGMVE